MRFFSATYLSRFLLGLLFVGFFVSFPGHSFAQLLPGNGIEGDPYIIEDCDDLELINFELEAHYEISEASGDLECLTQVFPIARVMDGANLDSSFQGFKGVFDGTGHHITYNIDNIPVGVDAENYLGLFGYVNGATIKNLDVSITGLAGANAIGSVAGSAVGSKFENVSSDADINASGDNIGGLVGTMETTLIIGSSYTGTLSTESGFSVGGLVGRAEGVGESDLTISRSYVTGEVSGINNVGGLVGQLLGVIENSYANASVSGQGYVGGLVGIHNGGSISNSYSRGEITAEGYVGGLVGSVSSETVVISSSFTATTFPGTPATQGTVVGQVDSNAEFNNTYWDSSLHLSIGECFYSGGSSVDGCYDIDTTGSPSFWKTASNQPLTDWDFEEIWTDDAVEGFALLRDYGESVPATQPDQVTGLNTSGITETSVVLGWTAPGNGGSAITDYTIRWRIFGDVSWTTIPHTASTNTQINLSGLTGGTTYEFQVAAVNSVGTGAFSNALSFTTAATVPEEEPERRPGQKIMLPVYSHSATNVVSQQLTQLRVLLEKMLVDLESASGFFTRDLYLGIYGSDVKSLQEFLVGENKGPAALALGAVERTEYFGVLTQAAVAEFQRVHGITPDNGYFGPKTRAVVNSRL